MSLIERHSRSGWLKKCGGTAGDSKLGSGRERMSAYKRALSDLKSTSVGS